MAIESRNLNSWYLAGDCIGNRKRIQPSRYAAKKTAYVDQEPVHLDEEVVSDEETGYYHKVHMTATSSQYCLYHDCI